ncbi:MAG TPA: preprotein translocase subunit SecG [Tepidisphaeraceae bacterium]|nr:preprotein translocase subunit SecG [Tepidisphaeraceae bacterium]
MVPLFYFLFVSFIVVCVVLTLVVLVQKGRGGGISSAFGGSGGNTAFGAKTGDVLTWATSVIFGLFILFAVFLNLVGNQIGTPRAAAPPTATPTQVPTPSAGGTSSTK